MSLISKEEFVTHCTRLLARIYPEGLRFDSSNYHPYPGWSSGCQMLAFNYQSLNLAMYANEAMFQRQGCCGYILKPEYMRDRSKMPVNKVAKLKVTIFNASQLPKQLGVKTVTSPFVELSTIGPKEDEKVYTTKVIRNNGYSPLWNESFEFEFKESIFDILLFSVFDEDRTLLGYYSITVESIRKGYRVVNLKDPRGKIIPCCNLFCHFAISKPKKNK